ncbi:MAG: Twin-arginine translocation pathway signal sequence domain protein precursor [Flavobacterium sp. MedPE-SWcel]|uniref:DUF1501 domain-containing protein n=1 Tax=uncultured Flavobacterium sp. TaxID=165435 RepID=UPI0009217A3F|nr:DUF1501 domain-containing protein [uncultured Flavobacterium sp.]OIQ21479.1 MAG: Twin-arginine translocation pathway signal sequence domain protein precursor [Flavobacterium sp. MedPE-SWcel]
MNRRNFFKLTGTCTSGLLMVPDFLYNYALQHENGHGDNCIVFVQLSGGNDGLNTYIPYQDELYYKLRPNIGIAKNKIINASGGMGFHPALSGFADIQQKGDLTVVQNVGYPEPNRSHFRSQEIWQTATASNEYSNDGWLGRFLDHHYKEHHPVGGINIDNIDNLALKGEIPNALTIQNPNALRKANKAPVNVKLSKNPQLDFVRKIAGSVVDGAKELKKATDNASNSNISYSKKSKLSKNLQWIAKLIRGGLNSKVYYTSLSGFDTHSNQVNEHNNRLTDLNDAVSAFYKDIKAAGKLNDVTIVVFSEFGRRVQDNGNGTDHGTAAPMFIIGGKNKGRNIGSNPNLSNLDANGDLIHQIDFRSVYASLLHDKFCFNPEKIGITNDRVKGIF